MKILDQWPYTDPQQQVTFPFIVADDLFHPEDLQLMEDYCDSKGAEIGTVGSGQIDYDVRKCRAMMHKPDEENQWFFDALLYAANHINDYFFQYDLIGFEKFQYTFYDQPTTHYDWHKDMILGPDIPVNLEWPRKLSFSLILSDPVKDFDGGNFEFLHHNVEFPIRAEQRRGRIIAFPSFMMHRVTPITRGQRKSIVFWACGPKLK